MNYSPDLSNKIRAMDADIKALTKRVADLENILGMSVSLSHLKTSEEATKVLINSNAQNIRDIEEKLSKITLPDDTRYYLEESEVQDFRSNFQKLNALMVDVRNLYDQMVAYLANNTPT